MVENLVRAHVLGNALFNSTHHKARTMSPQLDPHLPRHPREKIGIKVLERIASMKIVGVVSRPRTTRRAPVGAFSTQHEARAYHKIVSVLHITNDKSSRGLFSTAIVSAKDHWFIECPICRLKISGSVIYRKTQQRRYFRRRLCFGIFYPELTTRNPIETPLFLANPKNLPISAQDCPHL